MCEFSESKTTITKPNGYSTYNDVGKMKIYLNI